jgi:hypothetical protein
VRLIARLPDRGRRWLGGRRVAARESAFAIAVVGTLLGAATLRIWAYASNPSLSTDEAQLALNITGRPFGQLFSQLDFNQGAPPVFLAASKAAVWILGDAERSLRMLPFVAAVLTLPLFWRVARHVLDATASIVALVMFAASAPLVEFAITSKPYSSDVLVGLALYLLGIRALRSHGRGDIMAFASVGAVAVWLSYPAIFFLIGISAVLAVAFRRDARARFILAGATIGWVLSFSASYALARSVLSHVQQSLEYVSTRPAGAGGTAPALEASIRSGAGAFRYLLGIGHVYVAGADLGDVVAVAALAACVVGFVLLVQKAPAATLLVTAPLVIAAGAIAVGRYPLYPRTLLFAIPSLVLFAATGLAASRPSNASIRGAPFVAVLTAGVALLIVPGVKSALEPSQREGLRPAMRYLAKNERIGDGLYLYYSLQYSFRYYDTCRCFGNDSEIARSRLLWPLWPTSGLDQWDPALKSASARLVIGRRYGDRAQDQIPDLARVPRRQRVWIILGDISDPERNALLNCLSSFGKLRKSIPGANEERAAHTYLYEFMPGQGQNSARNASGACTS